MMEKPKSHGASSMLLRFPAEVWQAEEEAFT
jgi:hypothetical protein